MYKFVLPVADINGTLDTIRICIESGFPLLRSRD